MQTSDERGGKSALLQGTLDLLILRTLLMGARHGQAIDRSFYTLSAKGRKQLQQKAGEWRRRLPAFSVRKNRSVMFWRKKRTTEDFAAEIEAHLKLEAEQLRDEGERGAAKG